MQTTTTKADALRHLASVMPVDDTIVVLTIGCATVDEFAKALAELRSIGDVTRDDTSTYLTYARASVAGVIVSASLPNHLLEQRETTTTTTEAVWPELAGATS